MKTCYELFGIECNKGWEKLYGPLKEELENAGGFIHQIKEKYGGLRFYYSGPEGHTWTKEQHNEFMDRVEKAEEESFHVCEDCGEAGKLRTDKFWLRTVCDKHVEK